MKLLYVDLFCGAGGTSTGVENARINNKNIAKVVACVNHDKNAIASHSANHPEAMHFIEDIRTLNLTKLIKHLNKQRELYPDAQVVLWASLECTNFSKAKGGQARDADSRTLAEHLFRYVEEINPDYLQIENVEEFMCWGDLDENGKPVSKDKGRCYLGWIADICKYGYHYDWRILNSADYGAYTSRKRFFGIFARHGLPISFPEPTHSKGGSSGLFDFKKWKAVKEVLDLSDEGESIFTRKKTLSDKTLERIYAGLIKFVAGGKDRFLQAYYGNGDNVSSIEVPSPTVTTKDRLALVQSHFIDAQFGNGKAQSVHRPVGTITTVPKYNLVKCHYLMNPQFASAGRSINDPCFTLIARMDKMPPYLIQTEEGNIGIEVSGEDSENMVKIKEFMAIYGIVDIKMRMLRIHELKQIMGFPKDYVLIGTQADQKKFIGNAVECNMSRVIAEATASALISKRVDIPMYGRVSQCV